ncbi:MAG: DinB family protein [Calditrichaeota bacterium]|nr:MAG: DinB family protein [Calditrichota bacterium]
MTDLETQILETWRIHNRIMLFMLEHIPEEALTSTLSKRGGRDIARQLAHIHAVRAWRLESFSKKMNTPLVQFEKGESPSKEKLQQALAQSGEMMEKYLQHCLEQGGTVSNFKRGVVPMLGYYISHEAHHRGSILLTMKQSGFKLPDALKWQIWEWNKR